jgi:hypothetical protein
MFEDDRAVSVAVGYVLNLAIAAALLSALLVAGSGLIDDQTQRVTDDELSVAGHQLAEELSSADRLVRAGDAAEVSIRVRLPDRVAAGGYEIEIDHRGSDDRGTVELRSTSPEIVASVPFRSATGVANATVDGGSVRIEYAGGDLEVVST